jgi:DoxX-like protein
MTLKNQQPVKTKKIIYWIATSWLALGMVSTGLVQLMQIDKEAQMFVRLGYPLYLLTILGVSKILGVVAVLIPKNPLLKEWAYAGFFFTMAGAIISHIAVSDEAKEFIGPVLLLILTFLSWYYRPADRKIILAHQ